MRVSLAVISVALGAALVPSTAQACDNSLDLVRIPGATEAEAEQRYLTYERDLGVIARLDSEKRALEENWTVYLATVEQVAPLRVKPVWQVRGLPPRESQLIEVSRPAASTCLSRGHLPFAAPKSGALIVVFERPGSRFGMNAEAARSGELIDAISMYVLKRTR